MVEQNSKFQKDKPKINYGNSRRGRSTGPYMAVIIVLVIALGVCLYLLGKHQSAPIADGTATPVAAADPSPTQTPEEENAAVKNGAAADGADDAAPASEAQGQAIDPDSLVSRIARTLQAYYAAGSPGEKLKYVINPDRVQPLMRDYYFRSPLGTNEIATMSVPRTFPFEGLSYFRVELQFKNGGKGFAALRMIDDEPKVDWESEVRYSSRDWDQWLDDTTEPEGDFRVYAIIDQYYPEPFTDRSRYVSLKLRQLESARTLFAYLDLQDLEQRPLIEALANGQMQECTLRLKRVNADMPTPLARVVKVLSTSWIVTDKDEES